MSALQPEAFMANTSRAKLPSRDEIASYLIMDERQLVGGLVERAIFSAAERGRTHGIAAKLVENVRAGRDDTGTLDSFLGEYGLTSEEGVILMCLAEALLRIPDADTADQLIAEKIGSGKWDRHLGASDSILVNASTWGLMLTGRLTRLGQDKGGGAAGSIKRLVARTGEPVIRQALRQAMRILGNQFVLGRTIEEALARASDLESRGYRLSYDMLGEGARTRADAERYFQKYSAAIDAIGRSKPPLDSTHPEQLMSRPGLSVKLSAIHPRFEPGKESQLGRELIPKVVELARHARARGLSLTIDAEEQDRLDITLEVFGQAYLDPALAEWSGLGLAVQSYGRRAIPVLRWLKRLSEIKNQRIPVRLVKGAYWDSEIKWAQERGWTDYPVLTEKVFTDVSYLAALRFLMSDSEAFYPQFATHNAHTVATALVAGEGKTFEMQRLQGMGEALYNQVLGLPRLRVPVRIYAPVGTHEDLLAYLVRRLLENGANTSFVNRIADVDQPVDEIVRDPVSVVEQRWQDRALGSSAKISRPPDLFGQDRRNSVGIPISDTKIRSQLLAEIENELTETFAVGPIVDGRLNSNKAGGTTVFCPHDRRRRLGDVHTTTPEILEQAITLATRGYGAWEQTSAEVRAGVLERSADLMEQRRAQFLAILIQEAGKTLEAAVNEMREAVDFLRYYAGECRRHYSRATKLPGPTGETNILELRARGAVACISPWNFPIAIFIGQIAAALAAGNAVLAKPAGQTPIAAGLAVRLLHEAGVPPPALALLPGDGQIGAALVKDRRVQAIAFTGSNATAWAIQSALAARRHAIIPFIAETGGINAMIADSSALPEQVVRDAVRSAFDSAGQRCSAARILFVHEDIAERTLEMLAGATELLDVGDPMLFSTDVGPVIDEPAQTMLEAHKQRMEREHRKIAGLRLPAACAVGTFVMPAVYEIDRMASLEKEVFGPILHVARYAAGHLDKVITAINDSGFGLTLGLHTRLATVVDQVGQQARVGNIYINRNQIGAVVGVQPFGGEGLSGTGPKAGGPFYVPRFTTERVRSTDVTAAGGNIELLGLDS